MLFLGLHHVIIERTKMLTKLSVIYLAIILSLFNESSSAQTNNAEAYRQLELFGDVFERVRSDYVKKVTDEKLIESAINGMLSSLDPHSSYMSPKRFKDMQVQTRGEFGGLGIEVTMENGFVKVVSPIDDTPAFRAGIKAGDYITHLDGKPVQGLTLSQAVTLMRGRINTKIKLRIRREQQKQLTVTITRANIKIRSVRWRVEEKVGYIRITSFSEQTEKGLLRAISQIKKQIGDNLFGVILDLRNNPGGLLDQAIKVSDTFLNHGEIVSTRARRNADAQRYNATKGDLLNGKPIVILVNRGSASASEIVAGALQDHRRAIVLGTRSFGKGSVQTIMPLSGRGAIRLTTAQYFTPSGRSIQAKGIEPDIKVVQAELPKVEEPTGRRESDLRGALKNPEQEKQTKPPKGKKSRKDPKPIDYQLSRALDLVRGISLYKNKLD